MCVRCVCADCCAGSGLGRRRPPTRLLSPRACVTRQRQAGQARCWPAYYGGGVRQARLGGRTDEARWGVLKRLVLSDDDLAAYGHKGTKYTRGEVRRTRAARSAYIRAITVSPAGSGSYDTRRQEGPRQVPRLLRHARTKRGYQVAAPEARSPSERHGPRRERQVPSDLSPTWNPPTLRTPSPLSRAQHPQLGLQASDDQQPEQKPGGKSSNPVPHQSHARTDSALASCNSFSLVLCTPAANHHHACVPRLGSDTCRLPPPWTKRGSAVRRRESSRDSPLHT